MYVLYIYNIFPNVPQLYHYGHSFSMTMAIQGAPAISLLLYKL